MPIDERQERLKALDVAVGQIEKQFGKGSIMRLGQNKAVAPVDVISTEYFCHSGEKPERVLRPRSIQSPAGESAFRIMLAFKLD